MKLFDVYPRYQVQIERGEGNYVFDENGHKYLDFYGGHAVISIGHSHPHYIKRISKQLKNIGFYSNSVLMPIQDELAHKLGQQSGYSDYELFLVNSGAEAVENAVKLASFGNKREKVIAFSNAFHGRTSAAVQLTDNPRIQATLNRGIEVIRLPLNDFDQLRSHMNEEIAAVIVEGIQGIGGMDEPQREFLELIQSLTQEYGSTFILDEIQSGYGRTGYFFAHQIHDEVKPDLITVAKGMGNGFPVGAVLINPRFKATPGLLGTTFGGNQLACAASLAVLEVFEKEKVIQNARQVGTELIKRLKTIPQIKAIRGRGLMIAMDFDFPISEFRKKLIFEKKIFTGSAKTPNTMRLLPPLTIKQQEIDIFVEGFTELLRQ